MAIAAAGLRPWAPTNDREAEKQALAAVKADSDTGDFAERFDE
ncbi:NADH dehydrogenase FAD-containing subunit, partial [Mycolicibacterium pulveris]|nr:NADH dehydrogenase FAD-containing subunit [Mycolicibacterium pulveris]